MSRCWRPPPPQSPGSAHAAVETIAPQSVRVTTSDGIDRDVQLVGVHWDIGRKLLDAVRPPREPMPHPERDRMVRDWYRATSAWMIVSENHDTNTSIAHVRSSRTIGTSCSSVAASMKPTRVR